MAAAASGTSAGVSSGQGPRISTLKEKRYLTLLEEMVCGRVSVERNPEVYGG